MKVLTALPLLLLLPAPAASAEESWPAYLDYAFVYSSAEPSALRARLVPSLQFQTTVCGMSPAAFLILDHWSVP